ncbi:hypothetical protein JCM10296v2_003806 [Rhodotorula toruloides]
MLDSTGPAANTRSARRARDAPSPSRSHPSPHDPVASTSTAVNHPAHFSFHRQLQENALAKLRQLSGELEEMNALLEDWEEEQFEFCESLNEQDELAAEVVRERQQHRAEVNAFSTHYGQKQAEMKIFATALPQTLDGEGEVLQRIVYPHQTIVSKEGTWIRLALFLSPEQQAALPVTQSELKGHGVLEVLPAGIAISQADLDSVKSDFNSLVKEADKLGGSCRRLAETRQTAVLQQELILEFLPRQRTLERYGAGYPLRPRNAERSAPRPGIKLPNLDEGPPRDCIEQRFALRRLTNSIREYCGCILLQANNALQRRTNELADEADRLREVADSAESEQAWVAGELARVEEKVQKEAMRRSKIVERVDDLILSLVILSRRPA